ncbi:unnamed protein product [Moneuplotes crassus]|uniref:Uncharacterized protein n=1 Tax=Euplotes crassus TaxID=5936 RepID=A0AAD1XS14_EUPCR|nr:unnamed protein product [Moneuplotes crassus]
MDYFYKPPLQRQDECTALEENYVNCLVQKSFSDFKNFQYSPNTCKMDSILWFHLECPSWVEKFDDDVEFKRKFKNYFDKRAADYQTLMDYKARDKDEVAFGEMYYPDQVKNYGVDLSAASQPTEEGGDGNDDDE